MARSKRIQLSYHALVQKYDPKLVAALPQKGVYHVLLTHSLQSTGVFEGPQDVMGYSAFVEVVTQTGKNTKTSLQNLTVGSCNMVFDACYSKFYIHMNNALPLCVHAGQHMFKIV